MGQLKTLLLCIAIAAARPAFYSGWWAADDWRFLAGAAAQKFPPPTYQRPISEQYYWKAMYTLFDINWWPYVISRIILMGIIGYLCYLLVDHLRPNRWSTLAACVAFLPAFWLTAFLGLGWVVLSGVALALLSLWFALRGQQVFAALAYLAMIACHDLAALWPVIFLYLWRKNFTTKTAIIFAVFVLAAIVKTKVALQWYQDHEAVDNIGHIPHYFCLYGYYMVTPVARRLVDPTVFLWPFLVGLGVWLGLVIAVMRNRPALVLAIAGGVTLLAPSALHPENFSHAYPYYATVASCLAIVSLITTYPRATPIIAVSIAVLGVWTDMHKIRGVEKGMVPSEHHVCRAWFGRGVWNGTIPIDHPYFKFNCRSEKTWEFVKKELTKEKTNE